MNLHFKSTNGEMPLTGNQKAQIKIWLEQNEGKNCTLSLKQDKPKRTLPQNNFYWTYLTIIEQETGQNKDELHEFFKRKFLDPKFITFNGETFKIPGSTKDLSKNDMSEYMDKICALTDVPIPDPSLLEGYLPN